jgi:hypothetical protein
MLRALSVFFLLTGLRNPRCAKRLRTAREGGALPDFFTVIYSEF